MLLHKAEGPVLMFVTFSTFEHYRGGVLGEDVVGDAINDLEALAFAGLDEPQLAFIVGVGRAHLDRHLG